MKRIYLLALLLAIAIPCRAADLVMTVDVALSEVPVNKVPLVDDTDFKSIEGAVAYNASGMALRWHFVDLSGNYTVTSVTPTTSGTYDWIDQGDSGVYTIEIPATGGASINNDTEGFGWFTGVATGILPWTGPTIQFSPANITASTVTGGDLLQVDVAQYGNTNGTFSGGRPEVNTTHAAGTAWGSGAITAASIATDAIGSAEIAADAIGASEIATDAIGAAEIATDAIGSSEIAASAIGNSESAVDGSELTAIPGIASLASGTAQSGTSSTIVLASATSFADDILNGASIKLTGGTGAGQCAVITDFVGSTDTCTISPNWITNPSSDTTYVISDGRVSIATVGNTAASSTSGPIDANVVESDGVALATHGSGYLPSDLRQLRGTAVSSTGASNWHSFYDGTGYGDVILSTTVSGSPTTNDTVMVLTAGPEEDFTSGCTVILRSTTAGEDGGSTLSIRRMVSYNYDSAVRTLTIDSQPDFDLASGDKVTILKPTFFAADRTQLAAVHAKLPSKSYLAGSSNSDGDIQMDEATGNYPGTVATTTTVTNRVSANVDRVDGVALGTHVAGYFPSDDRYYGGTAGTFSGGRPEVMVDEMQASALDDFFSVDGSFAYNSGTPGSFAVAMAGAPWNVGISAAASTQSNTMGAKANRLPNIDAGASGGLLISGTNSGTTTLGAFTVTGAMSINGTSNVAQTGDSYARIGSNGGNLTSIPWNASWDAEAQSEANDALVANGLDTVAALNTTINNRLKGIVPAGGVAIGVTGNTTTALHLSGVAWANDAPNDTLILIQDVSTGLFYPRWIDDWADTGDLATVATLPFTPEAGVDLYWITSMRRDMTVAGGAIPSAATIADAVWDEAQSGHTMAGTFGKYLDAAVSGVSTGGVSTADIADAVWDELTSGHTTSSTFGYQLKTLLDLVNTNVADVQDTLDNADDAGQVVQDAMTDQGYTTARADKLDNADVATSTRLAPTTSGRTLDVTASGEAGIDLANVGSPTSTLNMSGVTIKQVTDVDTKLGTPAGTSIADDIANVEGGGGAEIDPEVITKIEETHDRVTTALNDAAPGTGNGVATANNVSTGNASVIDAVEDLEVEGVADFTSTQQSQILQALSVTGNIGVPKGLVWTCKRQDGQVGTTVPVVIDPEDEVDVACNFAAVLGSNDAIDQVLSVELVGSYPGDDVSSPAFGDVGEAEIWMATAVKFKLSGGVSGTRYKLKVRVLTEGGNKINAIVYALPQ